MKQYDLIVLGGGFAGVGAALAAARSGLQVLLADKGNCLGGAAVHNLVNPFMRWFYDEEGKRRHLSGGIFAELQNALHEKNQKNPQYMKQDKYTALGEEQFAPVKSFSEEDLKLILNRMMEEAGVELLFHAYLYEAVKTEGKLTAVKLATKSGPLELAARYFIDATGDAQLAYLAGCPTTLGRESDHLCQPMTLCFRVANADVEAFYASKARLNEAYKAALKAGELRNPRENILCFKVPMPGVIHFNTTRVVKLNPTDPFDVTKAEIEAREQVEEIYEFMKQHADGLGNSYLAATAPEIGVRESRMIIGDYVLTEQDCLNLTKFEDGIAACNYDIDIHNPEGTGTSHHYFAPGEYYTIPYRSLIPQGAENLLVAGRCISSDHGAQASYRIMPVVCCLGEAAGVAIGLAAKEQKTTRQVDSAELRAELERRGAVVR